MARSPRIDYGGAWHHVMNRGSAHQTIFDSAADGRHFLDLVGEGCELAEIRIAAYCLMHNHFHLLVNSLEAGLSEFMQRLSSMYTRYLNMRRGADGPIFRGRFRSLLVDTEEYLDCAGRYIHRNPVDIRPVVALDEWRWSSYRHYVGNVPAPSWLTMSEIRRGTASDYRGFVEGEFSAPIKWAVDMALLDSVVTDEHPSRRLQRVVALAVAERTGGAIGDVVSFASDDARRAALSRMRRRLASDPMLSRIVDRAVLLAA